MKGCVLGAVVLAFVHLGSHEVMARQASLQWLDLTTHARCLDGSPFGYYLEAASTNASSTKWVLYLAGGGECDNEAACKYQLTSPLGSSKYFSETSEAAWWYLASDDCTINEHLCSYNHVLNPYCTQDLHAGGRTNATDETWGLYFSGHVNIVEMLNDLDENHGMLQATEIIVFGVSAGGIGVWMNVDYVAQRYPHAKVTAATVAGHYFYANFYTGENHTAPSSMGDFQEAAFPETYKLYDAYVDWSCREAHESRGLSAGPCMLSNYSLPYIESDAFVVQAQTDIVVLTGHDCFPDAYKYEAPEQAFMEEFHANMTIALKPYMSGEVSPRRGGFSAACYVHTDFYAGYPLINGMNYYQAFNNFYFLDDASYRSAHDGLTASDYQLQDDCGIMCNPTCNGVPSTPI